MSLARTERERRRSPRAPPWCAASSAPHHALARDADVFETYARLCLASARVPRGLPLQSRADGGGGEVGILLALSVGVIASLLGCLAALTLRG